MSVWFEDHLRVEESSQSGICTQVEEKSLLQITNLKDSFSFSFLPGRKLHWPHSLLDFPCWYTKTNKRALWIIWNNRGSCSCLRSEDDLQSFAPGEDAAEQSHPCLHSFKSVPEVFPFLSVQHVPRTGSQRVVFISDQQLVIILLKDNGLCQLYRVKESILPCSCKPWTVLADSCTYGWVFEGLRMNWGGFHGVGKGLPGSASPVEVVTSSVGAQWLLSWKPFGFVPTLLPQTSCCATSLLRMGRTFFAFPVSIYSWPVCYRLFLCQHWLLA